MEVKKSQITLQVHDYICIDVEIDTKQAEESFSRIKEVLQKMQETFIKLNGFKIMAELVGQSESIWLPRSNLKKIKYDQAKEYFRREVLGEWVDTKDQYYPKREIEEAKMDKIMTEAHVIERQTTKDGVKLVKVARGDWDGKYPAYCYDNAVRWCDFKWHDQSKDSDQQNYTHRRNAQTVWIPEERIQKKLKVSEAIRTIICRDGTKVGAFPSANWDGQFPVWFWDSVNAPIDGPSKAHASWNMRSPDIRRKYVFIPLDRLEDDSPKSLGEHIKETLGTKSRIDVDEEFKKSEPTCVEVARNSDPMHQRDIQLNSDEWTARVRIRVRENERKRRDFHGCQGDHPLDLSENEAPTQNIGDMASFVRELFE